MTSPPPSDRSRAPQLAFRPTADAAWIWSLAARDPVAAAQRLVEDDSFALQTGTATRLRQRHFLLDSERVFRRACVLVALRAAAMSGDPPAEGELLEWFHERIDDATQDCLDADEIAHRDGLLFAENIDHYSYFTRVCHVGPEDSLLASLRFNRLPDDCRRAFFVLFVERGTIADALERGLGPVDRLRLNARRAVDAVAGIDPWPCQVDDVDVEGGGSR